MNHKTISEISNTIQVKVYDLNTHSNVPLYMCVPTLSLIATNKDQSQVTKYFKETRNTLPVIRNLVDIRHVNTYVIATVYVKGFGPDFVGSLYRLSCTYVCE